MPRIMTALTTTCLALVALTLYGQDREFVEAKISEWKQVVAKNPRDFETLTAIGSAYGKLGRHDTALEYFEKAIAANPKYAAAYLGKAASYGFLDRDEEKIAACKKAIALEPDNAEGYANLGSALGKSGKHKEAAEALKEAVRLKPTFALAQFALGLAYVSLADKDLAIKQSQTVDRLDPALAKELREAIAAIGAKK